jgi:catechol-2,3-dioxygenase
MVTPDRNFRAIVPRVRIGDLHLKVSDLERSFAFYRGVLGFELMQRWGTQAAFNPDGSIAMFTRPLDLDALLRDAR